MKQPTQDLIAPILEVLRAHPALREMRPAAFHLDGRDFLHFHELPEGVVADVRLSAGFVRMPASTPSEQAELLDRIERSLLSLEARANDRKRRGRGRAEPRDGEGKSYG